MTKTLTEQWREGTLRGYFYWKLPNGNICTAYTDTMRDIKNVGDSDEVEVLQETPSYVEYNELVQKIHILNEQNTKQHNELCEEIKKNNTLEKKLEIATKALEQYDNKLNWDIRGVSFMKYNKGFTIARKALKEIEGVK